MSIYESDIESPHSPVQVRKEAGQQVITEIEATLLTRKSVVTNKDIILELLVRLETETDGILLDVYRNALEQVVHSMRARRT